MQHESHRYVPVTGAALQRNYGKRQDVLLLSTAHRVGRSEQMNDIKPTSASRDGQRVMTELTINGLSTVRPDPEHDLVRVEASFDEQPVALQIHRGVLGSLIVSLLQTAGSFPGEAEKNELLTQPLELTGAG